MNRKTLVKAFIFVAGAAIGSAVTWKVVKNKYEQITQEEIKSVKEEYSRLTKLMRMEIDACHRVTEAHTEDEVTDNDDSIDINRDFSEPENNQVEYHKRIAASFASFILTIIGVSLSSRKRKGGMGLSLGIGLALSFGYIMLQTVSATFAIQANFPPALAAWLPNIIFAFVAYFCYRKAPR